MSLYDDMKKQPPRVEIRPMRGFPRYYLSLTAWGLDYGGALAATRKGAERKARRMIRRLHCDEALRAQSWTVTESGECA